MAITSFFLLRLLLLLHVVCLCATLWAMTDPNLMEQEGSPAQAD